MAIVKRGRKPKDQQSEELAGLENSVIGEQAEDERSKTTVVIKTKGRPRVAGKGHSGSPAMPEGREGPAEGQNNMPESEQQRAERSRRRYDRPAPLAAVPGGDGGVSPLINPAEAPREDDQQGRPHGENGFRPRPVSPARAESPVLPPALPRLPSMPDLYGRPEPRLEQDNGKPRLTINELIRLNMMDLRELAAVYNISHDDMVALKKQEIIFSIMKAHTERGGVIYAYGSLETLPDSYGFLRSPQNSYLPGPDDIYISPSQIRLFALKTGDTVYGQIRSPKEGERFFAMLRVETVNYDDPTVAQNRIPFDNLTPLYPE